MIIINNKLYGYSYLNIVSLNGMFFIELIFNNDISSNFLTKNDISIYFNEKEILSLYDVQINTDIEQDVYITYKSYKDLFVMDIGFYNLQDLYNNQNLEVL